MSDDAERAANDATEAVADYVAVFYECSAQIEMAKRRLAEAKLTVVKALVPTLNALQETDRDRIFGETYWGAVDLPIDPLVSGFGFKHINQVIGRVPPCPTGIPCRRCGVELTARSRMEMRKTQRDAQKTYEWYHAILYCDPCGEVIHTAYQNAREQQIGSAQQAWRERQQTLRSMRYADYLRSPEWQETRVAALKRSRYRCQLCGANQWVTLDVHHNSYERRGSELPADLIVLCRPCHEKHHTELPEPA